MEARAFPVAGQALTDGKVGPAAADERSLQEEDWALMSAMVVVMVATVAKAATAVVMVATAAKAASTAAGQGLKVLTVTRGLVLMARAVRVATPPGHCATPL
jgi:hypothetical protein